jgi:hypothetical protein
MQKALEGASRIIILAMISQSLQYYEESMNTINFATRAKSIVQIVHPNKANSLIDPATKQAYESKILELERKIMKLEQNSEKCRVKSTERDNSLDTKETSESINKRTISRSNSKLEMSITPNHMLSKKVPGPDLTSEMELQLENQIGSLSAAGTDLLDMNLELKEVTEIDCFERMKQQENRLRVTP